MLNVLYVAQLQHKVAVLVGIGIVKNTNTDIETVRRDDDGKRGYVKRNYKCKEKC